MGEGKSFITDDFVNIKRSSLEELRPSTVSFSTSRKGLIDFDDDDLSVSSGMTSKKLSSINKKGSSNNLKRENTKKDSSLLHVGFGLPVSPISSGSTRNRASSSTPNRIRPTATGN